MSDGSDLIVYTLEFCPRCEILKGYLNSHNIAFRISDLSSAESMTELRMNGVFVREAPVLQRGGKILTSDEMFLGDSVREEKIQGLL
ncbi:MAG: glutaredoxin family protein [Methanospirillaceae archaeon]|nr:glutaredoxin family protein [Methanospirillaceae archaeon]